MAANFLCGNLFVADLPVYEIWSRVSGWSEWPFPC